MTTRLRIPDRKRMCTKPHIHHEVDPIKRAPREVLGDQHRFQPIDQRLEPAEMNAVQRLSTASGACCPADLVVDRLRLSAELGLE